MQAESDPPNRAAAALLRDLPDTPQWVETRSILLSGECRVSTDPLGSIVGQARWPQLAVVGRPDPDALRDAASAAPERTEILVPPDSEDHVGRTLPEWKRWVAVIHSLPPGVAETTPMGASRVALLSRNRPPPLPHVPEELRRELEEALQTRSHVAAAHVDGAPVSFCYTASETETLWDVSIDTLAPFRRRGLALDCARFLIQHMTVHGKEPVWGSFENNQASLRAARSLGFRPVARILVFFRRGEEPRS
ncbi:MAG: GNAT family N-acetyltransferase [Thermoanaerobaculia bacterium]